MDGFARRSDLQSHVYLYTSVLIRGPPTPQNQVVERLDLLSMEGDGAKEGYFRVVGSVTAAEVRPCTRVCFLSTHGRRLDG